MLLLHFLCHYIIGRKNCIQFSNGLETVFLQYDRNSSGNLFSYISFVYICLLQLLPIWNILFFTSIQIPYSFNLLTYFVASSELMAVIYLPSIGINAKRNYVYMFPFNITMLENDKRLTAVSHLLHIICGNIT